LTSSRRFAVYLIRRSRRHVFARPTATGPQRGQLLLVRSDGPRAARRTRKSRRCGREGQL